MIAPPSASPADFTTIHRRMPGGPMELRVNMAACKTAIDGDYDWRIWAVASFQAPDAEGMPMDAERELISAAEREMLSPLPPSDDTLYAGSITHGGRYVAVLYSRHSNVLGPPPVSRVTGTKYTWDVYTEPDPWGEFLLQKLMLTDEEQRRIKDGEVLSALAAAGDNMVVPRPITFYGLFPAEGSARSAEEQLQRHGFRTSRPRVCPVTRIIPGPSRSSAPLPRSPQ